MMPYLLVGIGGFLGSVARYQMSLWVLQLSGPTRFPLGTLAVNLIGCLVIGLLAGLAERHALFSQEAKLLLFTGLIGGFTTFSAFGLETVNLLRRGEWLIATSYVTASLLLGLTAVWLGLRIIQWLPR